MDSIDEDNWEVIPPGKQKEALEVREPAELVESTMEHPVEYQKKIAVRLVNFLEGQIENEMRDEGFLSDFTRRWVKTVNELLESIHKSVHGTKSVSLEIKGSLSPSQITKMMRFHHPKRKPIEENEEEDGRDNRSDNNRNA